MHRHITRKASSWSKTGRFEEALDSFNKSIALKPDNAQAWYDKGSALLKAERLQARDRGVRSGNRDLPQLCQCIFQQGPRPRKTGRIWTRHSVHLTRPLRSIPPIRLHCITGVQRSSKKSGMPMPLQPTMPRSRSPRRIRPPSMKKGLPLRISGG